MLPVLTDLAEDFRVVAPDLPGFGASDAPAWTYTAEQLFRWLRDFLDAADADGAVVIGNSLGGRLALELAMREPDTVDKLVLLCPSPAFRRFRQLAPLARWWPVDVARLPMIGLPRAVVMAGGQVDVRPTRPGSPTVVRGRLRRVRDRDGSTVRGAGRRCRH
ncbi:alpha/beta fold hydrolase [Rhodococcus koreensis]|uniref:alpha/beta fold hydrolase n=1 Tax=Rhodococcus koreensis TaxID=99653 RepID=UPI0036DA0231